MEYNTQTARKMEREREEMLILIRDLADALETTEDAQDALQGAADEALLGEADAILARHGVER